MTAPEGFRPVGPQPDPVTWRAALVLARDDAGRVLMQLRDERAHIAAPGLWCLFGGAVEPGESLAEAARREFAEETGITLAPADLAPGFCLASRYHQGGLLHVFFCRRPVAPGALRLGEGAGFAFLNRAQLARYEVVENLREPLLAAFDESD